MKDKAGWATIEITPPLGLPMGGRGVRLSPGEAVLDPLQAQALVLEDGRGRRTLWLSLDLVGMDGPGTTALRRLASEITGIPLDFVLLNCSHTHSGPMSNFETRAWNRVKSRELLEYDLFLKRQVGLVAEAAFRNLQPVSLSWHEGNCGIGINRRLPDGAGGITMAPNPEGRCDTRLHALRLEGRHSVAVAFAHACHPVVVYGRDYTSISADFPSWSRKHLREELGADAHCQFFQGFTGNIRPRRLADLEGSKFRPAEPGDEEVVGRELGGAVAEALAAQGEPLELDLASAQEQVPLRRTEPPPVEFWKKLQESPQESVREVARYWEDRLDKGPPLPRVDLWSAGLLRLNPEFAVVHLGSEPVTEWLEIVAQALPGLRLMPWGYTNEVAGYLPTDALLPEGGYEALDSPRNVKTGPGPFAPGLDKAVADTLQRLRQHIQIQSESG